MTEQARKTAEEAESTKGGKKRKGSKKGSRVAKKQKKNEIN